MEENSGGVLVGGFVRESGGERGRRSGDGECEIG